MPVTHCVVTVILLSSKHNDDYLSAYAHNDTMLVREQQEVKAGKNRYYGKGTSSTRLHFEIVTVKSGKPPASWFTAR